MQSIQLATLDVDGLRTRLRKMSDEELREFGKAARYMVSPRANMGKPPLPAFVLQLEEARAGEWRKSEHRVRPRAQTTVVANSCRAVTNKVAFRRHQFIVRFVATVSNGKCSNQSGRDK
jgi:hypothetical protein